MLLFEVGFTLYQGSCCVMNHGNLFGKHFRDGYHQNSVTNMGMMASQGCFCP